MNLAKKIHINLNEFGKAEYSIPFLNVVDPKKRIKLFKKRGLVIDKKSP